MYDWSGTVSGKLKQGQPTGLVLKKGDVISVIASGWVRYANDHRPNPWSAPQGAPPNPPGSALAAKIGDKTYEIGNGILHRTVPIDGELTLLFLDTHYGDNSGDFYVNVKVESRYSPVQEIK
ncbi:LecA/PA-IL family lectin [Xenorhabdus cabanillasii]|uniref:PA-I galactophilic lectin (PA-IL) (Galactose-binding lectin) n=1 Tax=Xenorhabdus cabanillasii JM26 TaxID=1427517 RepID=W1J9D5_9GAMM|nr:LecA/PA-IL family lectin [Xenorhabdus cabanillasii]PHM78021.1 lectin [Xenorhabdus cabanillasii JM26]CDL87339.1 putative PA-I galactophilic lectin (PA-IL) (Galactose-binding lectin) [Xenorhabdus cabanillasii JM26]